MKRILSATLAISLIMTTFAIAQSQNHTIIQPGSTVKWLRCPIGQTWDGEYKRCQGSIKTMDWNTAMNSCPKDYRLPTETDYVHLLDCRKNRDRQAPPGVDAYRWHCIPCSKSPKCSAMFGNDKGSYWSSTPIHFNRGHAWNFNFSTGAGMNYGPKTTGIGAEPYPRGVRCINGTTSTQEVTEEKKNANCLQCTEKKRIECVRIHGNGTVAPDGRIVSKCLDMERSGAFLKQCGCQ